MRPTDPRTVVSAPLSVVLLVALSGVVVAQDGSAAPATTGPVASPGAEQAAATPSSMTGQVSIFGTAYETGDDIAKVRVDRFRELYPGVELRFSETGWDEGDFLTSLESSSPPDVVFIPRDVIGTYVQRGTLQPLDDCMASQGLDPADFWPGAIEQVTVDGAIYGFPQFFNTRIWMINEEVFQEAGLDAATFDWSDWEAIAAANEQLTVVEGDQVRRIGIDPKLPEFLPLWAKANGADLLSADGLTSQLEDPKVAEALTFAASLLEPAGGQAPFLDFRDTWDFFGSGNQFTTDELGAFPMEIWYVVELAELSPDIPLATAAFRARDGSPVTWVNGEAFAIVTGSPNAEAACAFAAEMSRAETWIAAAQARAEARGAAGEPNTGVYTGNRRADEVIFGEIVDLSEMPRFEAAVRTILEGQESAFAMPPSPAAAEFEDAWMGAVEAVTTGAMSAEEALAQADQQAQAAIDAAVSR